MGLLGLKAEGSSEFLPRGAIICSRQPNVPPWGNCAIIR